MANPTKKNSGTESKSSSLHPPYILMISEAITTMKDRTGSSQPAIAKFIEEHYANLLPPNFRKILSVQLNRLVRSEKLIKVKNSYKIPAVNKKSTTKQSTATNAAARKAVDKAKKTKRLSQVKTPEALKKAKLISYSIIQIRKMEGVSATVYNGIKGYWRRRGYRRLNADGKRSKTTQIVELASNGPGSNRKRRFWRIKLTPRLKLKLRFSPKKFLLGLRDAYVNMMVRMASTRAIGGGYGGNAFGIRAGKEYDERTIVEIYKSIVVAQGQLVPRDAAWICSEIAYRR